MKNKKLVIVMFLVLASLLFFSYLILKPKISAFSSYNEEKCENEGDDCWHSLAHQTFNREYCFKIVDNETQEHCLEHIPEINKEDK